MHLRLVPDAAHTAEPAPQIALDELLATPPPLADDACARLAALAAVVPGRQRPAAALLAATATGAAVDALLALPVGAPGVLEALTRCFAHGVARRFPPLALVDPPLARAARRSAGAAADLAPGLRLPPRRTAAPPLTAADDGPRTPIDAPRALALDFRSSRTRSFPDLVRRAQAVADLARSCATFDALDVADAPGGKRHYRLSFWTDRNTTHGLPGPGSPAAVAAALRAVHLDLTWLHARLVRLRGTRLWLSGWSFADDHPLGPAAQAHLLQAWLRWAEHEHAP